MEQVIIDIIDKKAAKQYNKLTPTKRKAYRAMLYAGAQININGYSVKDVAAEIGYSESGTSKLVQKWIELMHQGDVTVNLIIATIQKLSTIKDYKNKGVSPTTIKNLTTISEVQSNKLSISTTNKSKGKYILGFYISPEDRIRERAVKFAANQFFRTYGKNTYPQSNSATAVLGSHDVIELEMQKKWLPLETAAMYCGCKAELISKAAQNGVIERRVYKRNASRSYYEYNVADLDKFIRDNHLL